MKTIVVLYGDSGRLGSETITRLQNARSIAPPEAKFFCVGGARPDDFYWGSYDMRKWLLDAGVDAARVDFETSSYDTLTNVREINRYLEIEDRRPAVIVTDALHALRVRWISPNGSVVGLKLVTGFDRSLLWGLWRAQLEVAAWTATLILPDCLYLKILATLRSNSRQAQNR